MASKRISSVILACCLSFFAGELSAEPLRFVKNLGISSYDKNRVAVKKSEKDAISDLDRLVHSTVFEGLYAFLPGRNLWLDVSKSRNVTYTSDGDRKTVVGFDMQYLGELMKRYSHMAIWHTHPSQIAGAPGPVCSKKDVYGFLPSADDLASKVDVSLFFRSYQPHGMLDFRVRSAWGTACYSLTDAGEKHFYKKSQEYIVDWSKRTFQQAKDVPVDSGVADLVDAMRSSFVKISFIGSAGFCR